jgi:hypothetical protein
MYLQDKEYRRPGLFYSENSRQNKGYTQYGPSNFGMSQLHTKRR